MDVHSIEMTKNPYILFAVGWQKWLTTHFRSIIVAKLIPSKVLCFPQMWTILRRVTSYILEQFDLKKDTYLCIFIEKSKWQKKWQKFNFFMFLNFLGHSGLPKIILKVDSKKLHSARHLAWVAWHWDQNCRFDNLKKINSIAFNDFRKKYFQILKFWERKNKDIFVFLKTWSPA